MDLAGRWEMPCRAREKERERSFCSSENGISVVWRRLCLDVAQNCPSNQSGRQSRSSWQDQNDEMWLCLEDYPTQSQSSGEIGEMGDVIEWTCCKTRFLKVKRDCYEKRNRDCNRNRWQATRKE